MLCVKHTGRSNNLAYICTKSDSNFALAWISFLVFCCWTAIFVAVTVPGQFAVSGVELGELGTPYNPVFHQNRV